MRNERRNLAVGMAFLAPNILGFLLFTLMPLLLSFLLAFSNYDLRLHNKFHDQPVRFNLFENFSRLLSDSEFWRFLRNTLFMMLSVPFGIAASLGAALLLNRGPGESQRAVRRMLLGVSILLGMVMLVVVNAVGASTTVVLFVALCAALLMAGVGAGTAVYRTLFYLPSFTSGVAIYIVWAKLFNQQNGPINAALRPTLGWFGHLVNATPTFVSIALFWGLLLLTSAIFSLTVRRLRRLWNDGDLGTFAAIALLLGLLLPIGLANVWLPRTSSMGLLTILAALAVSWQVGRAARGREFLCRASEGFGLAAPLVLGAIVLEFVLVGLALVVFDLPQAAARGLEPPAWLTDYYWAKPAIMLMSLWVAMGSNNMLMYLAALSNMPTELYEAAEIDGASATSRFWNITWPQLAPTTFFIVVMSVIGGLQGGFDSARAMTAGGPAGSTTTLAYYVYQEGFLYGRLGYASSIAWIMFLMILVVTIANWKFGRQHADD